MIESNADRFRTQDAIDELLVKWNATEAPYPDNQCVHELFELQAVATPGAVAVVCENVELSYGELNAKANRLAHYLRNLGVLPNSRVALCLERGLEMVVGLLAVLKAGGAYIPLDPAYPVDRLRYMLEDSTPVVVLTHANVPIEVQKTLLSCATVVVDLLSDSVRWADEPSDNPDRDGLTPRHLAYVIYTSGSTGQPKGVMLQHTGVVNNIVDINSRMAVGGNDRLLALSSLSFDVSVYDFFGTLAAGATIILPTPSRRLDPAHWLELVEEAGVTIWNSAPAFMQIFVDHVGARRLEDCSLRLAMLSGDWIPMSLPEKVFAMSKEIQLFNLGGSTEVSIWSAIYPITFVDPSWKSIPYGKPLRNQRLYVFDESLQPAPILVPGELFIGGIGLSEGYWRDAKRTAESFVVHPRTGERLYKTGDLARYLPDGNLEFLGRQDFQVKIRGFRIELGEIEARLVQHETVREAVVLAREDEPGEKRLVAYCTLLNGADVDVEVLRAHLQATLPEYMVPAAYVALDTLPLTPNGKVDRKALGAPGVGAYVMRAYAEPEGEIEALIAQTWGEVLRLERIGRNDNFIELGGNSLLAMRMLSKLHRALSVRMCFADLFANPVLHGFAEIVKSAMQRAGSYDEVSSSTKEPLFANVATAAAGGDIEDGLESGVGTNECRLSFAQEQVWFLREVCKDNLAYHFNTILWFENAIDERLLREALRRVVQRHDVLRMSFRESDGQPYQELLSHVDVPLEVIDFCDVDAGARNVEARAWIDREITRPFDISSPPLVRWSLLRLGPEHYGLLQVEHHFVHDGWSFSVLVGDILGEYEASQTECSKKHAPHFSFRDYIAWQRAWIDSPFAIAQFDYWKTRLGDLPPAATLPTDFPRPASKSYRGAALRYTIDSPTMSLVRAAARRHGSTVYAFTLAAFVAFLARYNVSDDIVLSGGFANRRIRGTENMLGMVVNVAVLRVRNPRGQPFKSLLSEVAETVVGAVDNQEVPFERVVRMLQPERTPGRNPLFQICWNFHDAEVPRISLDGGNGTVEYLHNGSSKFDLSITAIPRENESLELIWEFDTDLFESGTAKRYLDEFLVTLSSSVADSNHIVASPSLTASEYDRIVLEWNAARGTYRADHCIHQLFEAQVEKDPGAVALVFEDAQLTYANLNAQANKLAHYLRDLSVYPESRVALCFERSPEMIIGLLAVLKAGGAYVPMDSSYPLERLQYMLQDTRPTAILTHGQVPAAVKGILSASGAAVIDICADRQWWADEPENNPEIEDLTPQNLAYIIYTSGSTGAPKGVMIEHRGLYNLATVQSERLDITPSSRVLQFASLSFDACIWEIVLALCNGASLYLPRHKAVLVGTILAEAIKHHEITHLLIPPAVLATLPSNDNLRSLRVLVVGGEAATGTLLKPWAHRTRLINAYGPTEATVVATLYSCNVKMLNNPPIGRPIANTRVYILDDQRQPVPIGVVGELYIGGAGVARGYLNHPELTAERFVASPFVDHDRLYRTGDLARYLPDGNIEFMGRDDSQVKVRGFRVELGEIEARLAQYKRIRQVAVQYREDSTGEKHLVAYYTLADGGGVSIEALRAYLSSTLPEYMVPAAYVPLEALPLTPNGKLDRNALPAPDYNSFLAREYAAPIGDTECAIAQIWCDLLKLERVSRHDQFFELGGHSLLAVRMLSRLRQRLGIEVSLDEVFAHPVLSDFARESMGAARCTLPAIVPLDRADPLPLSFSQQRLWFLSQMDGGSRAYHVPLGFRFKGELNREALLWALDQLAARHESLRTSFSQVDGELVQRIAPEQCGFQMLEHEIREHSDALTELDALVEQEVNTPFALSTGPLGRGRLIRLDHHDHVLLITLHHIIVDGWSMGILLRDLMRLYTAYTHGENRPLSALRIQYADYAGWQRRWLSSVALQEQSLYWRQTLANAPVLLDLPTDRPRPLEQDYRGGHVELEFDSALTSRLRALGRRHGTTLFMTLLAAWGLLLTRLSGQEDIVVGIPNANRTRAEVEELIGFFVNLQALRLDYSGSPTVSQLLQRVKAQTLAAQLHQDLPFEQVVELLNPLRSLAYPPLFQVTFAWQDTEAETFMLPEVTVIPMQIPDAVAKFDLSLSLREVSDRIIGRLTYATALFDHSTIERYSGYLRTLLTAMAANDEE